MFCPSCGAENQNGAIFCERCAAPLPVSMNYQGGAYPPRSDEIQSENPVISAIKRISSSRMFLAGTILITCSLVLTVVSFFVPEDYVTAYHNFYSYIFDEEAYLLILNLINRIEFFSSVVEFFPAVFVSLGLWLTYIGAHGSQGEGISCTGFSIIKTVMYFYLAILTLLGAVLETLVVISFVMTSRNTGIHSVYIMGFTAIALVFAVIFIFFMKLISTITTISSATESGIPSNDVSVFAATVCIVLGIGTIAVSIFNVTTAHDVIGLFIGICNSLAFILFGGLIFKFRSVMTDLKYFHIAHIMYRPPMPAYSSPMPPHPGYYEPPMQNQAPPQYEGSETANNNINQ